MDNEKIIDITENTMEAETPETEVKEKGKKPKRISINSFDKIMKNTYTPTETVTWNDIEIVIQKTISLKDVMDIVNTVVKLCFADDGTFLPEAKDIAIKSSVLEKYTNIALPKNLEHKYQLIYCTDAFETVLMHINPQQFNELCRAIDRRLDYEAATNIDTFNKQMNKLLESFENIEQHLGTALSGVDNESMIKLVDTINNGKFDESKLMESYFDIKENREQLAEAVSAENEEVVVGVDTEENG